MSGATAPLAPPTSRTKLVSRGNEVVEAWLRELVDVSARGLVKMWLPERSRFCFTVRRTPNGGIAPEGVSPRYTAIALLGIRLAPAALQSEILHGASAAEVASSLLRDPEGEANLGTRALETWAGVELGVSEAARAAQQLASRAETLAGGETVELAWTLSALVAAAIRGWVAPSAAELLARKLVALQQSPVFPHVFGYAAGGLRDHIACFADQVYPIQALSRWAGLSGDAVALAAASRCARRICEAQGRAGQWWWHYDARTGEVVEGYPVYSVHQDAMAPMALLDLLDAGGPDHSAEIALGTNWIRKPPEADVELCDSASAMIWRKIGRSDPAKLVRWARGAAAAVRPSARAAWLDSLFPPRRVDWECRPYHLGWVLHTWLQ